MIPRMPESLRFEHDEIRAEMLAALKMGGEIAETIGRVAPLLNSHLEKEGAFAFPPLAALPALARGEPVSDTTDILTLCRRLREELPVLLQEHQTIITALEELVAVAHRLGASDWARFSVRLMSRFRAEEELLYPAALLAGVHIAERIEAALE